MNNIFCINIALGQGRIIRTSYRNIKWETSIANQPVEGVFGLYKATAKDKCENNEEIKDRNVDDIHYIILNLQLMQADFSTVIVAVFYKN